MPRRTVQEVTVQDVQKRRNPNKHYVRRLRNLFFFSSLLWLLFQFLLLPDGGKTKRGSDYSGTRREPTAGWLVRSLESPGRTLTQLEWGGFCRSGLEQQEEKQEEEEEEKLFGRSLASAVALKQTSGW